MPDIPIITWDDIPDEGDWQVCWRSGRDEKGEWIVRSRRFRNKGLAGLFIADNCGRSLQEMLLLLEDA